MYACSSVVFSVNSLIKKSLHNESRFVIVQHAMRTKTVVLAAALTVAGALGSMAQVYSDNVVGYITLTIPKGFSLIANQLDASPDNTLPTILPSVPENTTV